jgi:hypothetical protein
VIFADAIVNRLPGGGALSARVALAVVLIVAVIGAAIIARRFLGTEEAAPPARGSHEPKTP